MALDVNHPVVLMPDDWLTDRATFEVRCRDGHIASPAGAGLSVFAQWWFLRLPPGDESLAPHLLRDGYWESWVSLAFARAVRPGSCVVDLGAHIGWFTLLALARGAAQVFAVEPQAALADLLGNTLIDNRLADRATVWCGAAAETWGSAELLTYGRLTGSAGLREAPGWTPEGRERVMTAPLDGLLDRPDWRRVDLVKVDVEGAEPEAWRGMQATLARNQRAAVLMEVGAGRGYSLPDFLAEILVAGWRVRAVGEDGDLVGPGDEARAAAGQWTTLLSREVAARIGGAEGQLANVWIDRPEAQEAAA